ncbi:DUF3105 domain-containing protein [Candidatus Peregrinibacteria bacterium]|nr:DUF3105 domain-containing protein [Candidatus Peregrinibacteria bacterium]
MAGFSRRQKISSFLWTAGFIVVLGALFIYIMWDIFKPLSGTQVEITGRDHLTAGETPPTYTSNPPTSGKHSSQTEEWGISSTPLAVEKLVHNLEHGGIVIYYNCEKCDDLVVKLKDLTNSLAAKDRKVILTPNKNIDAKIALSSWGYYDKMNELDEARIWKFFDDHINKGPERTF